MNRYQDTDYGRSTSRRRSDYGSDYNDDDRDFFDRLRDEVRSWFGDKDAERRRRRDERYQRDYDDRDRYSQRGSREDWRDDDRRFSTRSEWDDDYGRASAGYGRPDFGRSDYGRADSGRSDFGRSGYRSEYGEPDYGRSSGRRFSERSSYDWDEGNRRSEDFGRRGSSRNTDWDDRFRSSRRRGAYEDYGTFSAPGQGSYSYTEFWIVPGPYEGTGPKGYERSPDRIKEQVCERLSQHGRLDASNIEINVENDEVTLTGSVESRSAKRLAEDVAESVRGVRDVHNRLQVKHEENRGEGSRGTSAFSQSSAEQGSASNLGRNKGTASTSNV